MTSGVSGRFPDGAAILALALVPALLFAPALAGGVFFQRDLHAYWQPQVETLVRVVREGALPLWDPYDEDLGSRIADMNNAPAGGMAGSITAALFLRHFVGSRTWAHLDIAGPARSTSDKHEVSEGATGFGARLLLRYLDDLR